MAAIPGASKSVEFDRTIDVGVRTAAFSWLDDLVLTYGEVLPRSALEQGFFVGGRHVCVIGPPGIFKPASLQAPLSITTSPNGPYDDAFAASGLLQYRYRGTDPEHPDNVGLRFAMQQHLPLVYFHGLLPGRYLAIWPVYVVHDFPEALTFSVAVDDAANLEFRAQPETASLQVAEIRRQYVTTLARRRVHQTAFRERVLHAYKHRCSFCRLRHSELLEAAHIIPDPEPEGEPVVSNGLSLCRLHHAAFDRLFVGVRPDHVIHVRGDLLEESDGPTLKHAIQGLHGRRIILPGKTIERPGVDRLEERYQRFLSAARTV